MGVDIEDTREGDYLTLPEKLSVSENDRIIFIRSSLESGKSREETASLLGYKNWRSLDIYMRRKGMKWDSRRNTYYYPVEKSRSMGKLDGNIPPKIAMIISKFNRKDADPMEIARQAGFNDHRELSAYMAARGYTWSAEINNYIQAPLQDAPGGDGEEKGKVPYELSTEQENAQDGEINIKKYLPLFEILYKNRERLLNLLLPASVPGMIPRYAVPGITRTKSFYMSDRLSSLICEFSRIMNISQKEIIETAVIEFLKKYSFEREVDAMLGKS